MIPFSPRIEYGGVWLLFGGRGTNVFTVFTPRILHPVRRVFLFYVIHSPSDYLSDNKLFVKVKVSYESGIEEKQN